MLLTLHFGKNCSSMPRGAAMRMMVVMRYS
jgi:hypothetical protein